MNNANAHPTLAELDRTYFVANPEQVKYLLKNHHVVEATLELLKEEVEA
jgi:hypothetical protein